jgi:hypothetical protein
MPLAGSLPPKTRQIWSKFQVRVIMEILIAGVALVALMVFVSTKIKKSAATAFEREVIDTKDFVIIKPEGLINPLRDKSEFAFEAYSKEFGKNDAEEFNQMSAHLKIISQASFEETCENTKKSVSEILSENVSKNKGQNISLIEGRKSENEVQFFSIWKIVKSIERQKIYQLQVVVLENYREEYAKRLSEMLESFTVK